MCLLYKAASTGCQFSSKYWISFGRGVGCVENGVLDAVSISMFTMGVFGVVVSSSTGVGLAYAFVPLGFMAVMQPNRHRKQVSAMIMRCGVIF